MHKIDNELYRRGTVFSYSDRGGYGYILPDEVENKIEERLLVHRHSLRNQRMLLQVGDRVIYKLQEVPRGTLAADVHFEMQQEEKSEDEENVEGKIIKINDGKGFGFIESTRDKKIFFHFSQLSDSKAQLHVGVQVLFTLRYTEKGPQAEKVSILEADSKPVNSSIVEVTSELNNASGSSAAAPHKNHLSQAILAKDSRKFEEAAKLYEQGLNESPSVQLITSYAAMEKNRNRRAEAMRIYNEGMKIYPTNVKLREDAGALAILLGEHKRALSILEEGLNLCRVGNQGNEGSFLIALARVYYKFGSRGDLLKSLSYFQKAQKALESNRFGKAAFPKEDQLAMNLARIRVQHHRGTLTYGFVQSAGFRIDRANLFDETTVGADLVVGVNSTELVEGYGISGSLLVRCMFKSNITRSDIEDLDKTIEEWGEGGLIDDQVALLIVGSLEENVERMLYKRIEDRAKSAPAIVPITQSQIETTQDAMTTLRTVLDRWLYRRDLFALNFPVSGRRFFGRDRPLAELRDAIANGTAAGIFGLRKVGKTSLLKEIERRASEAGDIIIYMDLLRVPADVTDTRWLYWKLGANLHLRAQRADVKISKWRLGGKFPDYFDIPSDFPVATAFDADLTHVLEAIRRLNVSPRPKVVIMLDEIERIVPTALGKEGFTGFFDFFSYLRGVAQESEDFVPIITGANAAITEAAQFSGRDNPVFNFFREIYLSLLQTNESRLMISTLGRGMGIKISGETCDYIHKLTGGHPFFTRQFCSFVSERYPDRPLTINIPLLNGLIDEYLEVSGKDFQEILDRLSRDYPEELDACIQIAKSGTGIKLSDVVRTSGGNVNLRHLLGYQIVSISDDSVTLSIDLMRRWLKRVE